MSEIEQYNESIRSINNLLSVIKKGGFAFEPLSRKVSALIEKFNGQLYHYNNQKKELLAEIEGKEKFLGGIKNYSKDTFSKLNQINEGIEKFINISKSTLSSMSFKTLKNVKREINVENLFKFFFVILYHEKEENFDWDKFVKFALDKEREEFQKKLALFSIYDMSPKYRERLLDIKNQDYAMHSDNDDLFYLLEWLDYNYEAYLLLKEKDSQVVSKKGSDDKEQKYRIQIESSKLILDEISNLIIYLETNLDVLQKLDQKLKKGLSFYNNNPNYQRLESKARDVFKNINNFSGNELVKQIDQLSSGH